MTFTTSGSPSIRVPYSSRVTTFSKAISQAAKAFSASGTGSGRRRRLSGRRARRRSTSASMLATPPAVRASVGMGPLPSLPPSARSPSRCWAAGSGAPGSGEGRSDWAAQRVDGDASASVEARKVEAANAVFMLGPREHALFSWQGTSIRPLDRSAAAPGWVGAFWALCRLLQISPLKIFSDRWKPRDIMCQSRMSRPRHVIPNATYLITQRCAQRQFLLRPSKEITDFLDRKSVV